MSSQQRGLWTIGLIVSILGLSTTQVVHAQSAVLQGTVTEDGSAETMIGVNVVIIDGDELGAATDDEGHYRLELPAGKHQVEFRFVGYNIVEKVIQLEPGEERTLDVSLAPKSEQLDIVVVSGSLFEKNIEEEILSVSVIPANIIRNTNSVTLQDAVIKAPGVYFLDGQANIRGGSGYTYGSGSRVMVIVDDQPILTADRGEAQWSFMPMELVEQVEVIKGPSSVQYGASALNGVIHARTAWPGSEPETNFSIYSGVYDKPRSDTSSVDSLNRRWWSVPPTFTGADFSHFRRIDHFDLAIGGNIANVQTHLVGEYSTRARLSFKTRYRLPSNDRISFGLNGNITVNDESRFLIWADDSTGGYQPFSLGGGSTVLPWKYRWLAFDPWVNVFDRSGGTHLIRTRIFNSKTMYDRGEDGTSTLVNVFYQYNKKFFRDVNLTAGFQGYPFFTNDERLGEHRGFSGGVFVQLDSKFFDRLTLNLGGRAELYALDTVGFGPDSSRPIDIRPIFKAGLNYQAGPRTYIRASFGQGYRYPSMVELYATQQIGPLVIYENNDLLPEHGWNAEIGVKQSLATGELKAWFDAAFYWTEYFEMVEFVFGNDFGPVPGFKSLNISRARMAGLEFELQGNGLIGGKIPITFIGGYNYVYPADLVADPENEQFGTYMKNWMKGWTSGDSAFKSTVLKYRFRHIFRIDVQAIFGPVIFGFDMNYYSFMDNIDQVFIDFGIPPGIQKYRENNPNGDFVMGMRLGYRLAEHSTLTFLVQNLTNTDYALRVGKYDKPRNYTLQYRLSL